MAQSNLYLPVNFCQKLGCTNKAEYSVERTDLSHRCLLYCAMHAEPHKAYPKDFWVKQLKGA